MKKKFKKIVMIPNTDKDVEKSDHLCIADGNAKGTVILENSLL